MLLGDVAGLRDDIEILAQVFDPELIDDEDVRMEEPIDFKCESLLVFVLRVTQEQRLREPLRDRELAQVLLAREEVRMSNVSGGEIREERLRLRSVADDLFRGGHGEGHDSRSEGCSRFLAAQSQ